ncbi:MAG: DUF1080 domain-containing protein [Planctomycetaceae bacterium]
MSPIRSFAFASLSTALVLAIIAGTAARAADEEGEKVMLFNGKDLSNWDAVLADENVGKDDVWSVKDGVLHCKGRPNGYIRTKDEYENYELHVEWRWPDKGGNNGVLVHTTTPGAIGIWPKSIEVQLASGNAGDFWVIGTEIAVENAEERRKGRRHLNLTDDSEKPVGEWNTMDITCKGDEIIVKVNGKLVNHATKASQTKGAVTLQSEGTPAEFRNIYLVPLK